MKTCNKCFVEKAEDCFSIRKTSKDGYRNACKQCVSKSKAEYFQKNKDIISKKTRKYALDNLEKTKEYKKQYYQDNKEKNKDARKLYEKMYAKNNREKLNEKAKKWADKNRDKINLQKRLLYKENPSINIEAVKKWQLKNPDRVRSYTEKRKESGYFSKYKKENKEKTNSDTRNRRARIKNAVGTHSSDDINKLLVHSKGRCYWCGIKFNDDYHVDHVYPIKLGGENHVGNLCLSCPKCNTKKGCKHPMEFGGILL